MLDLREKSSQVNLISRSMNVLFVHSGFLTMILLLLIVCTHTTYLALDIMLDFTHLERLVNAIKSFIKINYCPLGFNH
jgi:hypothetical protein